MLSRIRSKAEGPHTLLATCNPHPDSFLLKFVQWYLNQETGIPIEERSGTTRYFAQYRGDVIFGNSIEEIKEQYGEEINPMSYTFISANIYSNPVLMKRDPSYVNRLENLKRSERDRLLYGSWYAREEASRYFKREWLSFVDVPCMNAERRVRAWDLAGTLVSESNRDPDYTASVLISRDKFGIYTIEDATRFRKLSGDVIQEIIRQAHIDGTEEVQVIVPRDTGAGGVAWNQHLIRTLAENGIPARSANVSGHKGKVTRFLPFASLAESGNVKIVKGAWNEEFLNELEGFDGSRRVHDDFVDSTSDATSFLAKMSTLPTFVLPSMEKSGLLT